MMRVCRFCAYMEIPLRTLKWSDTLTCTCPRCPDRDTNLFELEYIVSRFPYMNCPRFKKRSKELLTAEKLAGVWNIVDDVVWQEVEF